MRQIFPAGARGPRYFGEIRPGTRLEPFDAPMAAHLGNVLIVEDDQSTREMLSTFLSTEGFYAVGAEDGLEALHVLRTVKRRAPDVPCLVLLDLKMPRLGGGEFRRAQLVDPTVANVPVAVTPGLSDAEQRAQALGAAA